MKTKCNINLQLQLEYPNPSVTTEEAYKRNHEQNMFNRIALRYFQDDVVRAELLNIIKLEMLLESEKYDESGFIYRV